MAGLAELGLADGERVRWRRSTAQRWQPGVVRGVERDGSISLIDKRGAWRSIRVELIEHQVVGSRGGLDWEPVCPAGE